MAYFDPNFTNALELIYSYAEGRVDDLLLPAIPSKKAGAAQKWLNRKEILEVLTMVKVGLLRGSFEKLAIIDSPRAAAVFQRIVATAPKQNAVESSIAEERQRSTNTVLKTYAEKHGGVKKAEAKKAEIAAFTLSRAQNLSAIGDFPRYRSRYKLSQSSSSKAYTLNDVANNKGFLHLDALLEGIGKACGCLSWLREREAAFLNAYVKEKGLFKGFNTKRFIAFFKTEVLEHSDCPPAVTRLLGHLLHPDSHQSKTNFLHLLCLASFVGETDALLRAASSTALQNADFEITQGLSALFKEVCKDSIPIPRLLGILIAAAQGSYSLLTNEVDRSIKGALQESIGLSDENLLSLRLSWDSTQAAIHLQQPSGTVTVTHTLKASLNDVAYQNIAQDTLDPSSPQPRRVAQASAIAMECKVRFYVDRTGAVSGPQLINWAPRIANNSDYDEAYFLELIQQMTTLETTFGGASR